MVLSEVVNTQYAFPVGVVLICAILVFVFGFKSAEQPAFDQLTTYSGDDRKPAGKKRKLKEKKSQSNGHATTIGDKQAESKTVSTKATKSEKSPLKEVSNKVTNKQVKKSEASPIKDKLSTKQKDKKEIVVDKQIKEKKQATENSPLKDNKNSSTNMRGKGKENQLEELKNKKNEKNLAKLKNIEMKSSADEGGWKQVLSSKDKKNRKKDESEIEDTGAGKLEGTPKNKKMKTIELSVVDVQSHKENKDIEEGKEIDTDPKKVEKVKKVNKVDKTKELEKNGEESEKEKPEKKEKAEKKKTEKKSEKKKVEQESKENKDADEKVKIDENKTIKPQDTEALDACNTSLVELSTDTAAAAKKKSKKKADDKKEVLDVSNETGSLKKLSDNSENVDNNKKGKTSEMKLSEPNNEPAKAAALDESEDSWKEAKVPKKNKKKVRKDQ